MGTRNKSGNGRGALVALWAHPIHNKTDSERRYYIRSWVDKSVVYLLSQSGAKYLIFKQFVILVNTPSFKKQKFQTALECNFDFLHILLKKLNLILYEVPLICTELQKQCISALCFGPEQYPGFGIFVYSYKWTTYVLW
jgi:hypothetical protein